MPCTFHQKQLQATHSRYKISNINMIRHTAQFISSKSFNVYILKQER